jgi:hypothetical protein
MTDGLTDFIPLLSPLPASAGSSFPYIILIMAALYCTALHRKCRLFSHLLNHRLHSWIRQEWKLRGSALEACKVASFSPSRTFPNLLGGVCVESPCQDTGIAAADKHARPSPSGAVLVSRL